MRLTLRTLLAYRDHVLKAGELEDMHARVQQSAMAGNLLKRIESVSNRATILAPPVEGKGLGADANSIAEYLDDALKGDKVPELERICLESDVQLAELAQCHQLLSSALSTSVEVPPALRQRIVALGDATSRAKALAESPTGLLAEPPSMVAASPVTQPHPEGKSRFRTDEPHRRVVAAQQVVPQNAAAARTVATPQPVEAPMLASGGASIRPTGLDLEGSHLAHEVPEYLRGRSHDSWRGPLAIGALVAVLALLVWQSLGSWEDVRELFTARPIGTHPDATPNGSDPSSADPSGAANRDANRDAPAVALDVNDKARGDVDVGSTSTAVTGNPASAIDNPARSTPATGDGRTGTSPIDPAAPSASSQPGVSSGAAVPPQSAGPYAAQWLPTDGQAMQGIILVQTSGSQPLHRMQAAERVPSGTQIFVPPASRPKIELAQGPVWNVCGPTQMSVTRSESAAAPPQIDLRLGRALLTFGAQGPRVQSILIRSPDSVVLLNLSDATTRVAIDLSYVPVAHGPVNDRNANPPMLTIAVIEGQASVGYAGSNAQPDQSGLMLSAGQATVVARGSASAPQALTSSPTWIEAASDRPVDVLAAEDLERQLTGAEPIGATLQKLVTNRRPETRAMAAQSLALLGNWDWLGVEKNTLSDARDRSYWGPVLELTRQVIAANPDDATNLRAALVARDAARGPFQAEMWLGLTQSQLDGDGLSKLVDILDSEALLDRILAIYQLQRLTGKDLGYQAGEVNRASVQQWNRELATSRLQLLPLK